MAGREVVIVDNDRYLGVRMVACRKGKVEQVAERVVSED